MPPATDHSTLLDQLQAQVNLVLEQTGRVFAAISSNPKARPSSQLTKLKHVVPVASSRFHEALDQLESELQLAALVMRRDLAICREQSGLVAPEPAAAVTAAAPETVSEQQFSPDAEQPVQSSPSENVPNADADVAMQDDQSSQQQNQPEQQAAPQPPAETTAQTNTETANKPTTPPTNEDVPVTSAPLQLDTTTTATDTLDPSDQPPDTATNDLDSLFNDSLSTADATNTATSSGAAPDFSTDIDFGSFGGNFDDGTAGDNDNISSLLPGLEDYANTTGSGNGGGVEMDFSEFFNTTTNTGDGSGGVNGGMDQQRAGEQRDSTFDDLMDLAGFEGMEGDASAGNGGTNNDLDFDSLFN
ncbi:hypothetical protein TI39_contig342g00016 [Zymoseptoria brevis]|uniref:Uncharacterized protein n=1 Tax=Zymoseptoria brevis TaxID=1047168 RepID=A0A0F4GRS3_9PEZI|nr:hypothetical protein TI39_contig342g00016 [Zymoseptoria brevis]